MTSPASDALLFGVPAVPEIAVFNAVPATVLLL